MKFESGERREGVEEGERAGHNFSEVEEATSEKWKKQLLRSCNFRKHTFSHIFRKKKF